MDAKPKRSLARSTAIMTAGTVLSRVTGVVRLAIVVATLGIAETRLADTYNLANSVPNVIYELVLGGVVTSLFVPLFVELLQKEERERAWEVISAILNIALLALTAIALVGIVASPLIARFYALRLDGNAAVAQQEVITFLLRLFIPQIVLYGLYFVLAAVMDAHRVFGPQMFTPIVNNLVVIAVFLVFREVYGTVTLTSITNTQLLVIGLGTTLSVAPMGLGLIRYVRKLGHYRRTLALDHPSIRKLARLSVFVIGFVAANQIGYIVVQWLANEQRGAFTAYISAFTFFLLPIGLFVWSLTTALLPGMSAHAVNREWDAFNDTLSIGLRATIFVMLPAAVGFFILAPAMVEVFLEHGIVTPQSTELVTGVLRFLTLGLVQFSLFQMLVRAFYSMQDTKVPFVINCGVIALNLAINVPMFAALGAKGLAAGHAAAYSLGAGVQMWILSRRTGGLDARRLVRSVARALAASAVMGAVVALLWVPVADASGLSLLVVLASLVAVGAGIYLGTAHLMKAEEMSFLRSMLGARASRAQAGGS